MTTGRWALAIAADDTTGSDDDDDGSDEEIEIVPNDRLLIHIEANLLKTTTGKDLADSEDEDDDDDDSEGNDLFENSDDDSDDSEDGDKSESEDEAAQFEKKQRVG